MTTSDIDPAFTLAGYRFELPEEQIARRPPERRRDARLMVLEKAAMAPAHKQFTDILDHIGENDCLVLNDTSVLPARLFANKAESGGRVEVLLCREEDDGTWLALLNASKKVKEGGRLVFHASPSSGPFFAQVVAKADDEPGGYRLRFEGDARIYAQMFGAMPLPPYIDRPDDEDDRERYQTVFRDPQKASSAAAPTAGLHFDEDILEQIEAKGCRFAKVTLHVGPGTFLPVREDDVREHAMHAEQWIVPDDSARIISETKAKGGKIIAVGTTALRAIEASAAQNVDDNGRGHVRAGSGLTRLFLYPSQKLHVTDALITNFHLPESTLLMLVAAAVGRERILNAYADAIAEGYRFYSYGDASFLEVVDESKS